MSSHNEELCLLQAELTRLRSSVEQGEAQRVELQYQLTISQRDADRASQLGRDKHTLTERAAELQLKVQELQRSLQITGKAREEDQHALQQEVEERDKLIQSFSSENQRLHRVLQDQEEALEESERRVVEVIKETEKEAEVNRRQGDEVKYLTEREERSRREKELSDQRVRSLESSIEAERAAHLESKFNSELMQLRARDLEAALSMARSSQQEAQSDLQLLRAQFREVERAYNVERERSGGTERALECLQKEFETFKSELNITSETERKVTSDLRESLEEEKRRHADTNTLLEQTSQRHSDTEEAFRNFVRHIKDTLQQHDSTGAVKDDGNLSPSEEALQLLKATLSCCGHRQEVTEKQVQDLLLESERLQAENQTLQQLTSDQNRHMEESQQESIKLREEVTRLLRESSDWSVKGRGLQAELEKEREERGREKEERVAEVQKMMEHYQEESKARLSFLYRLYQRLLAGCVLLDQPQSLLGNFTWVELCDVIAEQVDQLTSDLRTANEKIALLQSVCKKKSVCVRKLQRSQECVLSRLEESVRRREEAWSRQHTHTITQLQNELQRSHSQCNSLRDHASSLELRLSSLTSDLSRCHKDSASFLSACALLAGALRHADRRLLALCAQKTLLSRRLVEREQLEEDVRTLAGALEGEEEEEEEEERRRRRRRRWKRSVWAVLAVRRWRVLASQTSVLLRVDRGGGAAVCVCGGTNAASQKGQDEPNTDKGDDGGREAACARLLHSEHLSSIVLSSMSDLQGALTDTGSSPLDLKTAAHSSLSRLLDHVLDQSDARSSLSPGRVDEETASRARAPQNDMKALVSSLQQHFLLFSQRLHSAEVERRSLRLEVTNLKRGLRRGRDETCRTVPAERFHSVCEELRQALSREQEAQTLLQEQTHTLHTLQERANTHTSGQSDTEHTLRETAQARQEAGRKERSLRIVGKHLSGVQREKKQLEERLQQVEEELRGANRCNDCLSGRTKAAETTASKVAEIPKTSPPADPGSSHPLPFSDLSNETPVSLSTAPSQPKPAPSSPLSKNPRAKRKERKAVKKSGVGRK
ncbi:coiled-coil domain-containing protein 171-like isoform X2 [Notolabrus celidotus]|uniref:coiled-coil domain-containing protein 171-like isoform X2 n=1 Tax=Notolabrus celidotus TaxID=1203425 RepID=UPI00148F7F0E|nr:coiled-coil domain-containing protein 171-like isoform X2 [Notolabrus celidotus]